MNKARRDVASMAGVIAQGSGAGQGSKEMFKEIVYLDPSIFDTIGPRVPDEYGNVHQPIQGHELDEHGNAARHRRPLAD
eukprot:11122705-Heterocapsa_arctica.AAC.1